MCFALSKLDSRLHIKVIFINQKCVGLDLDVEHLLEPLRSCFNYSHWMHPPTKCQSMQDFVFLKISLNSLCALICPILRVGCEFCVFLHETCSLCICGHAEHLCGNWKTWSNKSFYKVTKEHVSASYTDHFYNLINFSLWWWFWFLCQKVNTRLHTFPQELNEFLLFCQYHQRGLKQAYFNYLPLMLTFFPEVIKNLGLSTLILAHSLVSVAVLIFCFVLFFLNGKQDLGFSEGFILVYKTK